MKRTHGSSKLDRDKTWTKALFSPKGLETQSKSPKGRILKPNGPPLSGSPQAQPHREHALFNHQTLSLSLSGFEFLPIFVLPRIYLSARVRSFFQIIILQFILGFSISSRFSSHPSVILIPNFAAKTSNLGHS